MDSFVAIKKDKRVIISLDNKTVIERYKGSIGAISRFTARKEELKKRGYRIQHIAVDTVQGRRIEKSEPIQRQRKIRVLGYRVNE